ncbi:DUF6212 domain-containing protein [Paracoccus aestuariivivens]|uniref:Uncharacterized protein n=1 Tax=Paracoccus aestuariivivens TaxID=1820333 RepID=A0A6L6JI43_9RHOB|nr:DUF6212 domain-containing protein [Paracoccus aestuariivivens]MTH80237.1 hypothetical protein [Paracoccus aestuariivivens]
MSVISLKTLANAEAIVPRYTGSTDLRLRPRDLPAPELLSDVSEFRGYFSTDYWEAEDAMFLHPPVESTICAVLRGVKIGDYSDISVSVHAQRLDGPVLSLAIGIAKVGAADSTNWQSHVGAYRHVLPGRWAVVNKSIPSQLQGKQCDILISAQAVGRQGNDNAWALFRRFGFSMQDQKTS